MTAEQLYQAACAACHGADGKGQPQSIVGFDTPLPDFTDCAFTTPEADLDWSSVIHKGGRIRALDRRMPAFGDALSERGDRRARRLPARLLRRARLAARRPELSARLLHREGVSRKRGGVHARESARRRAGRVENGSSCSSSASASARSTRSTCRSRFTRTSAGAWSRGLGDVNVALKYALYDSLARGFIVSAGGEVTLPTGKESAAWAAASTIFEGFGMFGQALPRRRRSCSCTPGSKCRRTPTSRARRCTGARRSARRSPPGRWGRAWSPMVEVLGAPRQSGGADRLGRRAAAAGQPQRPAARAAQRRRAHPGERSAESRSKVADGVPAVGLVRRRPVIELEDALRARCGSSSPVGIRRASRPRPRSGRAARRAHRPRRRSRPRRTCSRRPTTASPATTACARRRARTCRSAPSWRASMMANSSRDPYWQAAVRRETIDHPTAAAAIEDECSMCHMPMARTEAHARRAQGRGVRAPAGRRAATSRGRSARARRRVVHALPPDHRREARHAARASPAATSSTPRRSAVRAPPSADLRAVRDRRRARRRSCTRRRSSSRPKSAHVRQSELCATCHTLYHEGARPERRGDRRAARAGAVSRMAAQRVPREERSCQSCHMPAVDEEMPIASVLGAAAAGARAARVRRRQLSSCCGC